MKKTLLALFILFSISCFSQLSNKHWIPPLHSRAASQISDQYVYLSTAETTPFLVSVTDGNGNPYNGSPFLLSANNPLDLNIGIGQPTKMFLSLNDVNTVVSEKGIILEGSKDFYVSFRMRALNHSETLISKGKPGIGTSFRLGCMINESQDNRKSFVASVMATEDDTNITLSGYNAGVVFESGLGNITLDSQFFENLKAGQSIVFSGYSDTPANLDGIIGALITSNKPVAVNTGNVLGGIENGRADIAIDQIVSASQIGNEYIFIEGNGLPSMETPLIIANEDGTAIYINDITTPIATIDAGKYYIIPNSYYQGSTNRNLYVKTSKPVFAYQLLGGGADTAAASLNFIPPLSCFFQNSVNIPKVNQIGNTYYTSDLMILTSPSATLKVDGNIIPALQSQTVLGNTDWVTYRISNVTGDSNVESSGPLAVGVFGFLGNTSGYAGYYSGFGSIPQDTNVTVCSNAKQDLFDIINGNPETGGSWTVPIGGSPLSGNLFDPTINSSGEYIYTFTKDCNADLITLSIKVNVDIQNSKNAGLSNSISVCSNSPSLNLFDLLGNADAGGIWTPTLASGTDIFSPAVDFSGIYTYSFSTTGSCDVVSATINVTNNVLPTISTITDFKKCDDDFDGNDTNGYFDFDLTTKTDEIIGLQTGINITYHTLQNEAELGQNSINTIYTNNRIIYVKLTNNSTGCFVLNQFNLIVNALPVVKTVSIVQCDEDTDGFSDFNLTVKNDEMSTNAAQETFSYYTSLAAAENAETTELIPNPFAFRNTTAGGMTVYTRVTNSNGCYNTAAIDLIVSTTQIPASYSRTFSTCDDLGLNSNDTDGIATFDFSSVTSQIIAILPPAITPYSIQYYKNEQDALSENDAITNTSNYRNEGYPNEQKIWVRVESTADNACYGLSPRITLTVNPRPNIDTNEDLEENELVCSNLPTFFVTLDAGIKDGSPPYKYAYIWSKDNIILTNQKSYTLDVNQEGNYTVEVISLDGCSRTRNIKVTASDVAKITKITIIDLSDINTVTVTVSGQGNYEYSLDAPFGPFQDSNFFDNVAAGIHEVYINDKNGCGTVSQTIAVIGTPKFFTPNGDGHNDYWNLKGVSANFNANSTIYIYDRYGKLLKQITASSQGWDGTFTGQPLPSDDYWYSIKLDDGREAKGNFSLKR
jgi:gliding motility-associated-like protein